MLSCISRLSGLRDFDFFSENGRKQETNVYIDQTIELEDNKEKVLTKLTNAEEEYQENRQISSLYTRYDFYNSTRINEDTENGEITFPNYDEIEATQIYDSDGNKIEEMPEITYNYTMIELSSPESLDVGNYYIIRYQSNTDYYCYYYISQLTNAGFQELELYIITNGDSTESTENETVEVEEEVLE